MRKGCPSSNAPSAYETMIIGTKVRKGLLRNVPAKIAILLKRKMKATSVAAIVCKPRKGEKAINTPMEKASAVRSGGSSRASRQRKLARNIDQVSDPKFQVSSDQR